MVYILPLSMLLLVACIFVLTRRIGRLADAIKLMKKLEENNCSWLKNKLDSTQDILVELDSRQIKLTTNSIERLSSAEASLQKNKDILDANSQALHSMRMSEMGYKKMSIFIENASSLGAVSSCSEKEEILGPRIEVPKATKKHFARIKKQLRNL